MSRLVVVSNRVPSPHSEFRGTEGGLAIAIRDALEENGGIWFGWSGNITKSPLDQPDVVEIGKTTYATVDLSEQDYNEYYSGYANSVLWPLFHYRLDLTDFSRRWLVEGTLDGEGRVHVHVSGHVAPAEIRQVETIMKQRP